MADAVMGIFYLFIFFFLSFFTFLTMLTPRLSPQPTTACRLLHPVLYIIVGRSRSLLYIIVHTYIPRTIYHSSIILLILLFVILTFLVYILYTIVPYGIVAQYSRLLYYIIHTAVVHTTSTSSTIGSTYTPRATILHHTHNSSIHYTTSYTS